MTTSDDLGRIDQSDVRSSLILIGTLGIASFLILPSIVIGMVTDLGFTDRQVGSVSTAQLISQGAGSLLTLWLIRRFNWRQVACLGVLALFAADLASVASQSFTAFLVCRFVAGFAGGITVSFASYALGQTREPDRNFGWFLVCQVGFAIVSLLLMPKIIHAFGIDGLFITLLILEALTIFVLISRVPAVRLAFAASRGTNDARLWLLCGAVLLGIIFFNVALGGFWTYITPIGLAAGLSEADTSAALGIGLIGGLAGAQLAASVNVRFGRIPPMLVAIGSQYVALLFLFVGFTYPTFVVAACLFSFGWYMLFPYQLGLLAALDRDGRPLILSNAVVGLGAGLGPFLVSFFLDQGFAAAYVICFLFLTLTLVVMGAVIFATAGSPKTTTA